MQYEHMRDKGPKGEPSLSEMTRKAIQILQKNKKGFFLLVEGKNIIRNRCSLFAALLTGFVPPPTTHTEQTNFH